MSPRPIHFVSLGCAKNRVDTEVMLGVSESEGYTLIDDPAEAEVIVINTCGFIDAAKRESIDTILDHAEYKKDGRCQKLVVAGCLSQRYPTELAESLPEVDHFIGSSDMLKLAPLLREAPQPRVLVGHPAQWRMQASDPRQVSIAPHSVYVKIAEGCNRVCAFCAIPGIRGKQRSRPVDDIVAEAKNLVSAGAVELNLVSQDTVAYGRDLPGRPRLHDLLRALDDAFGASSPLRWIRVHYLYPESLTPELFDLYADPSTRTLPYVDMPLQHGASNMLKRMRRGHDASRLYRVVDTIRERIPNVTFRTTFITGFPGETDADFQELLAFVRYAEFDHIGAFLYSHEEGTEAGAMTDLVPEDIAVARRDALMETQQGISERKRQQMVGHTVEVLIDGPSRESELLLEGRHAGQALDVDGVVHLAGEKAPVGTFAQATITHVSGYDLVADLHAADAPAPRRHLAVTR